MECSKCGHSLLDEADESKPIAKKLLPAHDSFVMLRPDADAAAAAIAHAAHSTTNLAAAVAPNASPHEQQRAVDRMLAIADKCAHASCAVPLCAECAAAVLDQLRRRLDDARAERDVLADAYAELEASDELADDACSEAEAEADFRSECAAREAEMAELRAAIGAARGHKEELARQAAQLRGVREAQLREEEELHAELNALELRRQSDADEALRTAQLVDYCKAELRRLEAVDVFADVFEIGADGAFGTINRLRLGRLPGIAIEWAEINAALGQVALLLQSVARACGRRFSAHEIVPMGSCSRIYARDEPRVVYDLYGSGSAPLGRLFGSSRFDRGLAMLLACTKELLEHATASPRVGVPPRPPHAIEGESIGGCAMRLHFGQEEKWTRASRCLLENLEWLLHWRRAAASGMAAVA